MLACGGDVCPPLEEAVKTMREGEHAIITIHPRVAFGSTGDEDTGIPPDTFLQYDLLLKRVWEVSLTLTLSRTVRMCVRLCMRSCVLMCVSVRVCACSLSPSPSLPHRCATSRAGVLSRRPRCCPR
jgi:hypothetical protein